MCLCNSWRVCVCSRDCAEVQALYRQSTEHAAEQSHLIQQLEGLNLDTQRVMRNQEEAHTADTTSYQKVLMHSDTCEPRARYYHHFVGLLRPHCLW